VSGAKVIAVVLLILVAGHWFVYRALRRQIDAAKRARGIEL
jgi:cbb3-type cytochrome oxidase subunit 3